MLSPEVGICAHFIFFLSFCWRYLKSQLCENLYKPSVFPEHIRGTDHCASICYGSLHIHLSHSMHEQYKYKLEMPNICGGCLPQTILPTQALPRDYLKMTYFPVNSKRKQQQLNVLAVDISLIRCGKNCSAMCHSNKQLSELQST